MPQMDLEQRLEFIPTVQVTAPDEGSTRSRSKTRIPNKYLRDFWVKVPASDLQRARKPLLDLAKRPVGFGDVMLAIGSASLSNAVSDFLSGGNQVDGSVAAWAILAVLMIGGFGFVRAASWRDAKIAAEVALEAIPDPTDTSGEE